MRKQIVFLFVLLAFTFALQAETTQKAPADDSSASALFERFKKLEGVWHGRSTKGWEDTDSIHVIAKGSAILSTSEFVDTPGEGMATVFVKEGAKLLLTHYCEAGNQPVLGTTIIEDGGNKVTFEFIGGTNIPTRDTGHMDKVVYVFEDENHFSSQWSWYGNGQEKWFENIHYERVK